MHNHFRYEGSVEIQSLSYLQRCREHARNADPKQAPFRSLRGSLLSTILQTIGIMNIKQCFIGCLIFYIVVFRKLNFLNILEPRSQPKNSGFG